MNDTFPCVIKLTNGKYIIKFADGSRGPSYLDKQVASQALAAYLKNSGAK